MSLGRRAGVAALVVAVLVYPFLDRAVGTQTVHAVSDGMIYMLLALWRNAGGGRGPLHAPIAREFRTPAGTRPRASQLPG